jgi:hypothetical protein
MFHCKELRSQFVIIDVGRLQNQKTEYTIQNKPAGLGLIYITIYKKDVSLQRIAITVCHIDEGRIQNHHVKIRNIKLDSRGKNNNLKWRYTKHSASSSKRHARNKRHLQLASHTNCTQ